jgi:hypothetical protein
MRPEHRSKELLGITIAKAKMYEYDVPERYHLRHTREPARLFPLTIGLLGDLAARINSDHVDPAELAALRQDLRFSARFFDAYCQSKLDAAKDPYLLIVGAAAYYLCGLPGSAGVLANRVDNQVVDLEGLGLERLLLWLLRGTFSEPLEASDGAYGRHIARISQLLLQFYRDGRNAETLITAANTLRNIAYDNGTARQLFFADIGCAVLQTRHANSSWYCLPKYTGLSVAEWERTLQRRLFIRELWPAQHLLGEKGIYRGISALVQMPTSAGKTRAVEIIIRSAFLSRRTSLAIVVTPFRALCHEVKATLAREFSGEAVSVNELSDVLQRDFDINALLGRQQILVVTPEKLVYVLRHNPELGIRTGVLIYDEGHQFDSGARGVTYELLLTALKGMIPDTAQTVLMSAVISNAQEVNAWLNGDNSAVAFGRTLVPTFRSIAFASWLDELGQLRFINPENPDVEELFVPRVIESHALNLRPRERTQRMFPEKTDGHSIALYLGLKLVRNGPVAVFCGTKPAAASLCERAVDVYNRGLPIPAPSEASDRDEVRRLAYLHERNLGSDATATRSASLGVFAHHGNIPHGIRLAVEHAMKEGMARFVVCTSTLAQGVNLPIRYLIVTGTYQGRERIKVRDFHNLIGRVGRSGMHTEGSVLFADPGVYDTRKAFQLSWRWEQVKELLDPTNSEPCVSSLLSIFDPLRSDDGKQHVVMEPLDFAQMYVSHPEQLGALPAMLASRHADKGFTAEGVKGQIEHKVGVITAIENYLMAHWEDSAKNGGEDNAAPLAKETLAYHLADATRREHIVALFILLASAIERLVPDPVRRRVFGRSLYGVRDSIAIEEWLRTHMDEIAQCATQEDLLSVMWPLLLQNIHNSTFTKCRPSDVLREVADGWIAGRPFSELYLPLSEADVRIGEGEKPRRLAIDHVVDMCENGLSYEGMLVIGAVAELYGLARENDHAVIGNLQCLQKRIKYGLSSSREVTLYELGFADRTISRDLGLVLTFDGGAGDAIHALEEKGVDVQRVLQNYPSFFTSTYHSVVNRDR